MLGGWQVALKVALLTILIILVAPNLANAQSCDNDCACPVELCNSHGYHPMCDRNDDGIVDSLAFCESTDSCVTCADCYIGTCESGGDCHSCTAWCGDGTCNGGETSGTCPSDCSPPPPPYCGDGICNGGETHESCPQDHCPYCGDRICNGGETCDTCEQDGCCMQCPNGACQPELGENCDSCPQDCSGGLGSCPPCTQETVDSDCTRLLMLNQIDCTRYWCDEETRKCAYDYESYQGRLCGNLTNGTSPYINECNVQVCIRGTCRVARIDSSDPTSAAGLPPLQPAAPWMRGQCTNGVYSEIAVNPYCGHWGCEAGETNETCCEDCPCDPNSKCVLGQCLPMGPDATTREFTSNWQGWIPLVVLALLFGYFLAALMYMVSRIISSPELEAFAKNELYETSVSAWLVGSAIFFVAFLSAISVQLIGVTYYETADLYIQNLSAELLQIYGIMTKTVFAIGLLGYTNVMVAIPTGLLGIGWIGLNGSMTPFAGMMLLSNSIMMFTNILSFAMFSVMIQKSMLDFVLQVGFRILLPMAIVLRSFTFTRKLGATLMAIAIGAYIVYPITLVLNAQIYASVAKIPQEEYHSSIMPLDNFDAGSWMDVLGGPNIKKYCDHWYDWAWGCWLFAIISWAVSTIKALFDAFAFVMVVMSAALKYGVGEVSAQGFDYFYRMIPWAMQPITAAFLFPVLDLVIVVTAIRSLSEAMGGESRITGLAQFI